MWMSSRWGASGCRHDGIAYSAPVSRGTQYFSGIPFPLNQKTNRFGIAFDTPAAYAVPLELNIASSGGKPIRINAPATPTPRRNVRRASRVSIGMQGLL